MNSWKLGNRNGQLFKNDVRQELDDYDMDFRKYMTTWERGIDKPAIKPRGFSNTQIYEQKSLNS